MSEIKFEKAMTRLEKIVEELEHGDLDIDKSLEIFEEGIKMSRVCSKKLNEAEAKIEKLTKGKKGELITELIRQDRYCPVPLEGQIIYLFALNLGMLDTLSSSGIKKFKDEVFQFVKDKNPGLIEAVTSTQTLTEDNEEQLGEVLLEFFEQMVDE